jgi:hypothetical protein
VITLPDSLRSAFKDPFGPVYTDTAELLAAVDSVSDVDADNKPDDGERPLIAVGDVVTYHLLEADRQPDVAVIDGKTEREAVDSEIETALSDLGGETRSVENPPAALSEELLVALREAIQESTPVTLVVDGEEDLATLPAILCAPLGASVIYGQPGAGMVHVAVTADQTEAARRLLLEFDGDSTAAVALLES